MSTALVRKGGVWTRRNTAPVDPSPEYDYVVEPGENPQTRIDTAPVGASILFKPGVHAANALNPKAQQTLVGQTGTIFDGGTALTSFTSDGAGHWYATATLPTYTESTAVQCEITSGTNANPCRKREQVWVDDVHLTRVMALSELNSSSEFYQDYAADRVYFAFDPTGQDVVMASKAYAISTSSWQVRVTGIKVQHYAPPSQQGAVFIRGLASEIDHCEITDTHAIGIFLDGANTTRVHDNHIHHVGQLGIGCHASHGAVIASNYLHHNNTDGYRPDDWESGDIKFTWSDSVIVEDNVCEYSRGLAIWGDIENGKNGRCYVRRNRVLWSYADGIRYEIGYACDIYDNVVDYSGFQFAADHGLETSFTGYSGFGTAGINVNTSRDVNVYGNTLGPNQNGIFAQFRPRATSEFPNRDLINFYAHDNDVTMVPVTLTGRDGNTYTSGLKSGEGISGLNTLMGSSGIPTAQYYDGTKNNRFNSNTYRVSATGRLQYAWNQGYRSWETFRSAGQEALGVQVAATRPGWQITAAGDDGNWHTFDATGYYSATGTKIYIGDNSTVPTDADRCAWLRFHPHIPPGATITAAQAFLFLYATGLSGVAPNMLIDAELSTNAAQPTSKANVAGRARTTSQVAWPSPTWTANSWLQSPSIHTILQELVNQPGWTVDSPVLLFLRDNQPGNVSGQVSFNAYETDPALTANLQAAWS